MALQARALGKRFPGVVALNNVDMTVEAGQVMALVGANGAGKSTFIKILTGYYEKYEGQIEVDGQPVTIHKPLDASQAGIQAVYQEVDTVLLPDLTVAENLLFNEMAQDRGRRWMNWRQSNQRAQDFLNDMGLHIQAQQRVEALVLHEKQMLVIARAVLQKARYIIFDEPTTSLSLREVDQLFEIIRRLKDEGIGIIYISHRLAEVREIADEITIFRHGEKISNFPIDEFDIARISTDMLGTAVTDLYPPKIEKPREEVALEVRNLNRKNALHDISFKLYQGEILGIAGLVGAGKTELLRALFGADPIDSGEIWIDDRLQRIAHPTVAVEKGIFLIPEERRSQGILVDEPIYRNISLPFLDLFSGRLLRLMRRQAELQHARRIVSQVGVNPPDELQLVENLSGGNQQKVVIGKWFGKAAKVTLFDEATQGIDVGAKRDVYELAQQLCETSAIIYASSDIDEVIGVANRVLVMHDGRIVAEFTADQIDRNDILAYATGSHA